MKKLVLIALIFISCSTKYTRTGDKQKISEDKETISYNVSTISEPSLTSPYLRFAIEEKMRIREKYREKIKVKKTPNFFSLTPLIGAIPGWILRNIGYVGLGETAIGASLLTVVSTFGIIELLPAKTKWETTEKDYVKKAVPLNKKFSLLLEDANYSLNYVPDKSGTLEISMADFDPYYEKGRDFNFSLISPEGSELRKLKVPTESISSIFSKKKETKYPPNLQFTVNFKDEGNRDNILDAYEKGNIILEVENQGEGIAEDLEVRVTPLGDIKHLSFPEKGKIMTIEPGEIEKHEIPLQAEADILTGEAKLKIEVLEPYFGADAASKILAFKTREYIPPELVIYDKGVEEGWIEPRKTAHLSLVLQNKGGSALGVKTRLGLPADVSLVEGNEEEYLGEMDTDSWHKLNYTLYSTTGQLFVFFKNLATKTRSF